MNNESFFGLSSLIRPKKEILWIGADSEIPERSLGSILSQIKFSNFKSIHKHIMKSEYRAIVVSILIEKDMDVNIIQNALKGVSVRPIEKILILKGQGDLPLPNDLLLSVGEVDFAQTVCLPAADSDLQAVLKRAVERQSNKLEELNQQRQASKEIGQLTDQMRSLDSDLQSRNQNMQESKLAIEAKISNMRALVRFVKDLTEVVSVEDLMKQLRDDCKRFHRLKEPVLAFANNQNQLQLMYFQGSQVIAKVIPGAWPQQIRIRLNDQKDSQFLANLFGRPFGKLLTLPLNLKRKGREEVLKVAAVLFFEHSLEKDEMDQFLKFIEARHHLISMTLDRMLLETDLNEGSLLWERTFDGILDPVAIFDSQNQIIRANKSFADLLGSASSDQLQLQSLILNGKQYQVQSYPISFGSESLHTHIINHYVDVTAANRLQRQMVQSEKMAALGHLAGHIAHELNNPLTGIRASAQILVSQKDLDSTLHSDLVEVERAAERCQVIIKNLIDFSSGGIENKTAWTTFNEIVQKTLPLLKTLINRYEVQVEMSPAPGEVMVEPYLMQQVVFNVINNAAQAMGEAGHLEIKTFIDPSDPGWSQLVVKDSGMGIPEEIRGQIFESFFTTKSKGQGTGLGLSISKTIIDRFNGKIEVQSQMGVGTQFTIKLPNRSVEV